MGPNQIRIPKMQLMPYSIAYIHRRSPTMALWWSVLLPGFGHLFLGATMRGLVLMGWEAAINHLARLNLAIYYSILGDFGTAGEVLRLHWAILYPFIYLFAIWDSYRLAVEMNDLCAIEEVQSERSFARFGLHPFWGIASLDKRNPWMAAFFGTMAGSLGHVYNGRFVKAAVLTAWYIAVMLFSRGHYALAYTLEGRFREATAVIDYQWFLFWPSIALFNVVNAYTDAVELNNVFDTEWEYRMRDYLKNPSRVRRTAP